MGLLPPIFSVLLAASAAAAQTPHFDQHPAGPAFQGRLAAPRLVDEEERRYADTLLDGVKKGYEVVDGGTENERTGANFAGHYVLVQWGCGSNCMKAALVDGLDGTVLRLPQIPGEDLDFFEIPTGSVDLRTLEFRLSSRLLGIPRVADGQTYYYVLERHRWRFLSKAVTPKGHP